MANKVSKLDKYFFSVPTERALFNAYLIIFLATAIVTLLGILNLVQVKPSFLEKLFTVLILEVIGGIASLFGTRVLQKKHSIKYRLNFIPPIEQNIPYLEAKCTFIDHDAGKDAEFIGHILRDDFGWCIIISPPKLKCEISIAVENNSVVYQGSDYLEARTIDLQIP